jgi:hypothetical protein
MFNSMLLWMDKSYVFQVMRYSRFILFFFSLILLLLVEQSVFRSLLVANAVLLILTVLGCLARLCPKFKDDQKEKDE